MKNTAIRTRESGGYVLTNQAKRLIPEIPKTNHHGLRGLLRIVKAVSESIVY